MGLTFVPEYEFARPTGFMPGLRRPEDSLFVPRVGAAYPRVYRQVVEHANHFQRKVEDQRQTSSCTWNALGVLKEYLHFKKKKEWADFSRLFGYYFSRARRGWENTDSGALISDCFEVAATMGSPLEPFWMFKENLLYVRPDARAVQQAKRNRLIGIKRVAREDIFNVLSGGGDPEKARPVVGGFIVYQHRFFASEVVRTGWIDAPARTTDYAGWHAMAITGYNVDEDWIEGPQSWGEDWATQPVVGRTGWYRMSGQYLRSQNFSMDFWTAEDVEVSGDDA